MDLGFWGLGLGFRACNRAPFKGFLKRLVEGYRRYLGALGGVTKFWGRLHCNYVAGLQGGTSTNDADP